jgi:hypothetical protein
MLSSSSNKQIERPPSTRGYEMTDRKSFSFAVDLVSGPAGESTIDDFEIFYARRALRRLKTLIGRDGLLQLLADDIEVGNSFMREHAVQSNGVFRAATTVMAVEGLKASEFVGYMDEILTDEAAMLAAQPEHFVMTGHSDETAHIVENLGPHVCSFLMGFGRHVEWAAAVPELLPSSEFPFKKVTNLFLEDGTDIGRVLAQFGDTPTGFTANLTVYFPVTCSEEVFEHHRRHFAVEFSNWMKAAAALHP